MISLLKQKIPINIFIVFVLGIVLKILIFSSATIPITFETDSYLFIQLVELLNSLFFGKGIMFAIATYLLLYSQALQLNNFLSEKSIVRQSGYLPAMSYILISSLVPEWNYFSASLLCNSFILFILSEVSIIGERGKSKTAFFNVGLAVGLSIFLYSPALILVLWLFCGFIIMRSFKFNTGLICLLGIATPFYFYSVYLFFVDQFSWLLVLPEMNSATAFKAPSGWLMGSSLLLGVPFLMGGFLVRNNFRQTLVSVRNNWNFLLLLLLFALAIPFLNSKSNIDYQLFFLMIIPVSTFHSYVYLSTPTWFSSILFWGSVIFILAFQYYTVLW